MAPANQQTIADGNRERLSASYLKRAALQPRDLRFALVGPAHPHAVLINRDHLRGHSASKETGVPSKEKAVSDLIALPMRLLFGGLSLVLVQPFVPNAVREDALLRLATEHLFAERRLAGRVGAFDEIELLQ